ncbi:hypothetical protein AVEN_182421-1 [Araneus ventricosus]|uniref:RNase H type-1 domain-containing protein n=1 Tax=Araneus ventricosus TaxID=182803 RepID=A0A4Y2RPE2_ARAVE|nr:hypothetical protein AVEN_193600-1 [Araneus ventricosus]GBN68008.1 hypothetical protein AVEN_60297-1 [Araneus ventricosus]GBN77674.1 hypothetical protein AVEN_6685-1 [Araneus ventricosus]GBN77680.1 hypothetical protein AVEN_182421-1 [Araneus ventricosus]
MALQLINEIPGMDIQIYTDGSKNEENQSGCGVDHEVHLQWIPSHVDIYGNEVADDLTKQGTAEPLCSTPSLTFDEIYSIRKNKDLKTWRVPPSHDWYKRSSPGGTIGLACDRADQTALSRFVSGHQRSCSFCHGNKVFPACAKCGVASASPEHILSCLRLSREISRRILCLLSIS